MDFPNPGRIPAQGCAVPVSSLLAGQKTRMTVTDNSFMEGDDSGGGKRMGRIVIAYAATIAVFLGLDLVWLTGVGPAIYDPVLRPVLAPHPRLEPAVAFYLLYVAGLQYFAVLPGLKGDGWKRPFLNGALFGFFAYATYDLTNQATLIVWSSGITLLDMGWGAFVSGVSSAAGCAVARAVSKRWT
jgi:uncharacterized membrane protein